MSVFACSDVNFNLIVFPDTSKRSLFSRPTLPMVMEDNQTYIPTPVQGIDTQGAIWKTLLTYEVYFALILVVECQIVPRQIFSTKKLNPNNDVTNRY